MPVSIPFDFQPPADPDITELHIEEAPSSSGPWVEIDVVLAVGTYPDYISEYTTDTAVSTTDWFRLRWKDANGAYTPYSQAIQGGVTTLVAQVKKRVMQRDPSLVDAIVYQEAEAAIEGYFGIDPYDPSLVSPGYKILNGLVYLTLARSIIARVVQQSSAISNVEKATLGLVSFQSGGQTSTLTRIQNDVQPLLDMANAELGLNTSVVLLLEQVQLGSRSLSSYDHSRLIAWTGLK